MSEWPETSENLILRVRDPRDAAAWAQLVAVYRPVVQRMARARGVSHEDTEDLVQGVFLSVARAVGNWEPQSQGPRFRHWLGRITRNAVLNALTRGRPDRGSGSTDIVRRLERVPEESDLSETLLRETRLEAIRWAAREVRAEFSPATWEMFQATAGEGRPAAEVARACGRSVGAVYAARCRVLARLREKVEECSTFWSEH